jgi:hypothetical protein
VQSKNIIVTQLFRVSTFSFFELTLPISPINKFSCRVFTGRRESGAAPDKEKYQRSSLKSYMVDSLRAQTPYRSILSSKVIGFV